MHTRIRIAAILIIFVAVPALPTLAVANPVPDFSPSWCEAVSGHLVVTPGGSAASLADRGMTIEIWIRDQFDRPIPQYPSLDIWLDDTWAGDVALCQRGALADAPTDAEGHTTISGSIAAGGWTQRGMSAYVSGQAIYHPKTESYSLSITVNSPDINGDREVGLADVTLFVNDLQSYAFRSDFNNDGAFDLADITTFTNHIGESCP